MLRRETHFLRLIFGEPLGELIGSNRRHVDQPTHWRTVRGETLMANDEHVALLKQGVDTWNAWRDENPDVQPDLNGANLRGANLRGANLRGATLGMANLIRADLGGATLNGANLGMAILGGANFNGATLNGANLGGANLGGANFNGATLNGANLGGANLGMAILIEANLNGANLGMADLSGAGLDGANLGGANFDGANFNGATLNGATLDGANLREANLDGANLGMANLIRADLNRANLSRADLNGANLSGADLNGANLSGADLTNAVLRGSDLRSTALVETILRDADLTGCRIYGISAWDLKLDGTKQRDLVITPADEPEITVDNIEVAQFVYLLLHNDKIRQVIDTITSKAVLILGRFTDERKAVLDALREELRKRDYLPILFDFEKPRSRDTDETITLLARMARFVIADVSDAKAVLQELRGIVPDLPSLPVQPIILAIQEVPGMFDFYRNRPSFLPVHRYADQEQLLADLGDKVIRPAELKVRELRG
jgi:uncharacterized protein YjbI with pentapeptide repeats